MKLRLTKRTNAIEGKTLRRLKLIGTFRNNFKRKSIKLIDELFLPIVTRLNYNLESRVTAKGLI